MDFRVSPPLAACIFRARKQATSAAPHEGKRPRPPPLVLATPTLALTCGVQPRPLQAPPPGRPAPCKPRPGKARLATGAYPGLRGRRSRRTLGAGQRLKEAGQIRWSVKGSRDCGAAALTGSRLAATTDSQSLSSLRTRPRGRVQRRVSWGRAAFGWVKGQKCQAAGRGLGRPFPRPAGRWVAASGRGVCVGVGQGLRVSDGASAVGEGCWRAEAGAGLPPCPGERGARAPTPLAAGLANSVGECASLGGLGEGAQKLQIRGGQDDSMSRGYRCKSAVQKYTCLL
jgi:hypothetical protein